MDGLHHPGQVHFMDFHAPADFAEQGNGQVAAEMFPEFVQAREHLEISIGSDIQQFIGKKIEAESFEQREDTFGDSVPSKPVWRE